jgi:hypothetical protein
MMITSSWSCPDVFWPLRSSGRVRTRAAIDREPHLAQAHYGLGVALEKAGDGQGARRELADYARLEPRSYLAWRLREAPPALPW